jgi:hypothetical protein
MFSPRMVTLSVFGGGLDKDWGYHAPYQITFPNYFCGSLLASLRYSLADLLLDSQHSF